MNREAHYQLLLNEIVEKFNSMDVQRIMSCFTEDVQVRYNDVTIQGAASLREFLRPRYEDMRDYHLAKTLRTVSGNTVGIAATARFVRRSTGEHCVSRIHEFLDFDGDRISHWDYVGHVTSNASSTASST